MAAADLGRCLRQHCWAGCSWAVIETYWLLGEPRPNERWFQASPWGGGVLVECKPDLGDDFPAVLRQVLRYPYDEHGDRRCVVVRRHGFRSVTWEQVGEMYAASAVQLVATRTNWSPRRTTPPAGRHWSPTLIARPGDQGLNARANDQPQGAKRDNIRERARTPLRHVDPNRSTPAPVATASG